MNYIHIYIYVYIPIDTVAMYSNLELRLALDNLENNNTDFLSTQTTMQLSLSARSREDSVNSFKSKFV